MVTVVEQQLLWHSTHIVSSLLIVSDDDYEYQHQNLKNRHYHRHLNPHARHRHHRRLRHPNLFLYKYVIQSYKKRKK